MVYSLLVQVKIAHFWSIFKGGGGGGVHFGKRISS